MTQDAGPAPHAPGTPPTLHPKGSEAAGVAAAIGNALGPPLEVAHGIVQEFIGSGRITRLALQQLGDAMDDARQVARQTDHLAGLDAGPPPDDSTPQRLDILVSQALARQMPSLRRHRVQLQQQAMSATWALTHAGLLPPLIDAAIVWCTRPDHRLVVSLDASGDIGTTLLRMRLQPSGAPFAVPVPGQQLSWHVLQALARSCGVRTQQQQSGMETILTLALQQHRGAAADSAPGDLLTSHDSLLPSDAVPLRYPRVLLVTRDDEVRAEVEHVCASLGAAVDWVATGAAAMRQFAQTRADLVLADARDADAATVRLQQQLLAEAADFPWVNLVQEASSASLTQWMREDGLTLNNLRSQLAEALLYGLPGPRSR